MKYIKFFEAFTNSDDSTSNLNSNINSNFWKWFGKSKTLSKNNSPLILYHGTNNGIFDIFDISDKSSNHPSNILGYFFTPEKDLAYNYSLRKLNKFDDELPKNKKVYEVYLKIENPFYINYNDYYNFTEHKKHEIEQFKNDLINKGYDGIIVGNNIEFIVFHSNQIKSIDNDGTWDEDDNNIYS